jgi:NhaP-type Na+/H+ or K+/H+ antiporter
LEITYGNGNGNHVAYLVVTAGRGLIIFGASALLRRTRERIPWAWSVILTWGGLRGGLPMVLVLSLPKDFSHSIVMQRLLTGYAVAFNLRHWRRGHLFQNRYKSVKLRVQG